MNVGLKEKQQICVEFRFATRIRETRQVFVFVVAHIQNV